VSARGPFDQTGPAGPPDPGEFRGTGSTPPTGSPAPLRGIPPRGAPGPGRGPGAPGSTAPLPARTDPPAASFARYAALLRELDRVRAGDEARTESWRRSAASMNAVAEEIGPMIVEHGQQLEMLGRQMRMKVVRTGAQRIAEEVDPVEALNTAKDLTNQTAVLANEARRQGTLPAFLPTWRPAYRNFLIYLACAVATGALQYALFLVNDNNPPALLVLFVLPLVSWIAGLTVIRYYGQPAIPPDPASRRFRVGMPPPPDPMTRSPRMGVLLCFGAFPIWYAGTVADFWLG